MDGDASEIEQRIKERIDELPTDIQEAVLSADLNNKIQTIGTTYRLHIDQAQELSDLTMLVMLGFMPSDEFKGEVTKQLQVNPDIAQKIISDINTQVFLPIRESMKQFASNVTQDKPAETAPASKPASPAPLASVLPISKTPVAAQTLPPEPHLPATAFSGVPPMAVIKAPDMHPADTMLTQKTVTSTVVVGTTIAPTPASPKATQGTPPKPGEYKADPYREPTI